MYYFVTDENVWELNVRKIFLTLFISVALTFILCASIEISVFLNLVLSLILGLISSLISIFFIRAASLYDQRSIGKILTFISSSDWPNLEMFLFSFNNWYDQNIVTKRKVIENTKFPIYNEIILLRNTYYSCSNSKDFNDVETLTVINRLRSKSKMLMNDYNLRLSDLELVVAINSRYRSLYSNRSCSWMNVAVVNDKLKNLNELSTFCIAENHHSIATEFVKVTLSLKDLISYNTGEVPPDKLLTILDNLLTLNARIEETYDYQIFKLHVLLQLENVYIFSNEFGIFENQPAFQDILTKWNLKSEDELKSLIHDDSLFHPIFDILRSTVKRRSPVIYDSSLSELDFVKINYPDVVNIGILNLLSRNLSAGDKDGFLKDFEYSQRYFTRESVDAKFYEGAFQISFLLYNFLNDPEYYKHVISGLVKVFEDDIDLHIKKSALINAFVIAAVCDDEEWKQKIIGLSQMASIGWIANSISSLDSRINETKKIFFIYHHLPYWYPVRIPLDIIISPKINETRFSEFIREQCFLN